MNFTLQPFTPDQQDFLFKLYANTRQEEVSSFGWPAAQQETFLRMQFNAQQNWYAMAYSGADHQIIVVGGQPVGRILVFHELNARRLVDIAVLSDYRSRGIGTQLLRDLLDKSDREGIPVRLQVLKSNRARSLYQRLGFVVISDDGMYYQMERRADASS
jgi:ribosomal protein S18 acetylase RimI-like enzyme